MTETNEKIVRVGHRNSNSGIITIASVVTPIGHGGGVQYGVSFASPKDRYNKQYGIELARTRLRVIQQFIEDNDCLYAGTTVVAERTHSSVVLAILCDLIARQAYPDWAQPVILSRLKYITGKLLG